MVIETELRNKYKLLFPYLDERQRRLVVGGDALVLGRGGISAVSRTSGLTRPTVSRGIKELQKREDRNERIRKVGGGRKRVSQKTPAILEKLKSIIEPATDGAGDSPLLWTKKSTRQLAQKLWEDGYKITHPVVAGMLHQLGYRLRTNRKLDGNNHPDFNRQFQYIYSFVKNYLKREWPIILVKLKKKELEKNIPNIAYTDEAKGVWTDTACDADTASIAIDNIQRWWNHQGEKCHPNAQKLLVIADSYSGYGEWISVWKDELQNLAGKISMDITVCHFPAGTSKWNKIKHYLSSQVRMNGQGQLLVCHEIIINLIGTTHLNKIYDPAEYDKNIYLKKIAVTDDDEWEKTKINYHNFYGEWNYSILQKRVNQEINYQ